MKRILRWTLIFLLTANYSYAQQSSLPFENNEITIEKIMAGFFAVCVYFIPTIIARDKIHFKRIFIFNFLIAWTVIGWFISFLWAINAKSNNTDTLVLEEDIEN
ncbi:heme/copper-type cytochrome/quinol oxidase subunit 2 [Flavobacterium sp. 28A]|uniref:superinfection immunity protein n=1 Tax=Flavobacterium sp. 28A TaxID=2735895 RepID=UPI00156D6F72|nr:superinfection immunity protein [Flavobacterium sp. 28A]NRT16604.1 heme/copper-type cytochrome/quinol oxidase subunit 2 [Flavobacterium sp. 28A]